MNPQKAQTEHLPCKETQIPNRKAQKSLKSNPQSGNRAPSGQENGQRNGSAAPVFLLDASIGPSLVHNSSLKNGVLL